MATQNEILAKANEVTTAVVNSGSGVSSIGGLLNAEQSNRFIAKKKYRTGYSN